MPRDTARDVKNRRNPGPATDQDAAGSCETDESSPIFGRGKAIAAKTARQSSASAN